MVREIFTTIGRMRLLTRRIILFFAASASAGVVLIPLSYRAHIAESWIVVLPTIGYFGLAAFRLLGGFQTDRQIEFEERFIRFAIKQNKLLASVQGFGKLWKLSCVVQGLSLAEQAVSRDSERGRVLQKSLTASSRVLLPPVVWAAMPAAVLVAASWVFVVSTQPSTRGIFLYLAVLPCLAVVGYVEAQILASRKRLKQSVLDFVTHVAKWGEEDWIVLKDRPTLRPFRHRLFYRDRKLF